jgi:hypothetical protein
MLANAVVLHRLPDQAPSSPNKMFSRVDFRGAHFHALEVFGVMPARPEPWRFELENVLDFLGT